MKNAGSKPFYYAAAFWTVCNLLLLWKGYLGGSYDSMEATAYSFPAGLLALYFLHRRAQG